MTNGNRVESEKEWEERMGLKVLSALWETLLLEFPYLSPALTLLTPAAREGISSFATDGKYLYFRAERLLILYRTNEKFLLRALLHTVLHCLYGHLWFSSEMSREMRDPACDIFTEGLLDELPSYTLKRALSWIRQQIYKKTESSHAVSPMQIAALLREMDEGEQKTVSSEFFTDDHRFWPEGKRTNSQLTADQELLKKAWEEAARRVSVQKKEFEQDPGKGSGSLETEASSRSEKKHSYRLFLKRFSALTEELKQNQEEFDLISYTYGLKLYGNMPLVEPLESREEMLIRDFIIAIDTSYSTSGNLVKAFLKETFQILMERDSFAGGTRIHVLQCDDAVRSDDLIRSWEDVEKLTRRFCLKGGGGTDFRPVFSYVKELRRNKKMKKPAGLLYFTDGLGRYPEKAPDYKTAFLFLSDYDRTRVPSWCINFQLDERELR